MAVPTQRVFTECAYPSRRGIWLPVWKTLPVFGESDRCWFGFFPIFTGAKGSVCLNEAPSGISVAPVLQLQLTGIYKTISKTYGHEDLSVNSKLF